jgi:hypothetical protein
MAISTKRLFPMYLGLIASSFVSPPVMNVKMFERKFFMDKIKYIALLRGINAGRKTTAIPGETRLKNKYLKINEL